ncbi:hypothetical protein HHI36_010539 [Cryptolaemus montrouzieri]
MKLCGNRLVEAMSLICKKRYNSPNIKRSINFKQDVLDDSSMPDYSEDYSPNAVSTPYLDRLFDNDNTFFIPMRHQRGIVDECCKKSCSREDLEAYCY